VEANVVDKDIEELSIALRPSRTDLARLIGRVVNRHRPTLCVDQVAVTAWQTRAPEAWREATSWLASRGILTLVIPSRHSGHKGAPGTSGATQSAADGSPDSGGGVEC